MRNTIILSAILFIAVIAASIYYFKNLDNNHSQSARPLRFLPSNTLMIAAIGNDAKSSGTFKDYEILDAFVGFDNSKLWSSLKTKLLQNDQLKKFTSNSDIYISFHPEGKDISSLFTIPTSENISKNDLMNIVNDISRQYKTSTKDTLGHKFYGIHYGEKDSILHTLYYHNILFASPSLPALYRIVEKHSKHLSDNQIEFFLKDNPRTSPLSIYFPHQQYDSIISLTQRNANGPFLNMFKKLHGQSAFNINFKKDALILTGESQLDQYPENYASIFKNQQKTVQDLYQYFPSNTAIYASFSVSNQGTFKKDLHALFKRRNEKIVETIDNNKNTELLNLALGNQFALIETNAQNNLGFVNIKDSVAFENVKHLIMESSSDSISRITTSNILYQQFGDVFKDFLRPYCTVIDSVLVFANHLPTLKAYRQDFLNKDLLIGTLGYIKIESIQSKEANITILAHARNVNNKFINALNQPFKDNFKNKDKFGYQDFFSWSIQLSGNNGNMSSQIYAIYKSENTLGGVAEWDYSLENKAITRPYVMDQTDTNQFILIQELDHTLHAIHPTGEKIWSKVFAGRIIGEIQQMEDRSIVFITDKNNLYRIDPNGVAMKGFPISISGKPTASTLITTIQNQKVFLIPMEKNIEAYTSDGKGVTNWKRTDVEGRISTSIITKNNKYIVGTSLGNIYWFNEKGEKIDSQKINYSVMALQPTNSFKIIALDNKGGVTAITEDNKVKSWQLAVDSSKYYTRFTSLIGSSKTNFAVLNNNRLEGFDIKDTIHTLFEYNFTKSLDQEIQLFTHDNDKNVSLIGIASKATNLLYVLEETGQLIEGFPVEGLPLFYYGKINYKSATYLLCMRRDHKLYAFRQKN